MRDVFAWAALCCLISSTADDAANVSRVDAWSSFRPFKANNTEAYAYADWVRSQIAPRDAVMTDATCRERVVAAAKTAQRQGFAWNAVGCSFPASWRYDSAEFSTIKNCTLLSGSPYQRATEQIILRHDHLREDITHCDKRAPSGDTLLQRLKCDGFATINDWGLPTAFVDALASEAFAKLDDAARIAKNKAVVSTKATLDALETIQGKLFWQNSSLLRAAVQYLGPEAELTGYEALRLTNELNSVTQYRSGQWHHDRCGSRLKAFLFLRDVRSAGARPTQVARGSHKTLYWSYHDMGESRFSDAWVERNYEIVSLAAQRAADSSSTRTRCTAASCGATRRARCSSSSSTTRPRTPSWRAPRRRSARSILRKPFRARAARSTF